MSKEHPVIAITGSSGAGTSAVKTAFQHIFIREKIKPLIIEGDSFHRFDRKTMKKKINLEDEKGNIFFSHFGEDANDFKQIAETFKTYGETGKCKKRYYLHSEDEARVHNERLNINISAGEFTPWEENDEYTDLLFYEGLHGAVITENVNVAQHADLKIGVVPSVNLEWIQKIHRDNAERGYSAEETVDTILRRMPDYVRYITPQFSNTDINFQRVAIVDTSNPFITRDIPTPDESMVVIRFNDLEKHQIDFPKLLAMLHDSFMTRRNTIVIPGGKMGLSMEIILGPIIKELLNR